MSNRISEGDEHPIILFPTEGDLFDIGQMLLNGRDETHMMLLLEGGQDAAGRKRISRRCGVNKSRQWCTILFSAMKGLRYEGRDS